jgi:hypothetical protein
MRSPKFCVSSVVVPHDVSAVFSFLYLNQVYPPHVCMGNDLIVK